MFSAEFVLEIRYELFGHLLPNGLVFLPSCVPSNPLEEIALVALLVDLGTLGAYLGLERVLSHFLNCFVQCHHWYFHGS